MSLIDRKVEVQFRHQIHFEENVFSPDSRVLRDILVNGEDREVFKAFVIIDEGVSDSLPELVPQIKSWFETHNDKLKLVAAPMLLEGGERLKNSYFHVSEIQSQLERYGVCRHSYLIAIGGGAMLDVVGLAAATAHRGVRHVRLPTTTLSQDDSGVGVKNGINAFGKKNFVGSFAPPFAVVNDFQFIRSLPEREKRAGYVEAVKVALIRDEAFFDSIEEKAAALAAFEEEPMKELIYRSAELHVNHICSGGDPFEVGSARPLDFGHWAAHKLEQLSEYRISHGEAVGIGIALDSVYARRMGFLKNDECDRILNLLEKLGFQLFANELFNADSKGDLVLLKGLEEFREHLGGRLTITLLEGIGRGFEIHEMNPPRVIDSLYELKERFEARGEACQFKLA